MISVIAAVDENGGMGKNNRLLCHLPADLNHFKQLTLGKPIIMGRKTFDSIGRALPGRQNIVLSKQKPLIHGVTVVESIQEALHLAEGALEVMVIGGADVFEQALPLTQRVYLTMIHHSFDADVFFPKLDPSTWELVLHTDKGRDEKNPYDMTFYQYERR